MLSRRAFTKQAAVLAACSPFLATSSLLHAAEAASVPIFTQQYPWGTFYRRSNRDAGDLNALLAEVKSCGLVGYEPIAGSPQQMKAIADAAKQHDLKVESLYVNSTLHDPGQAAASIQSVLDIAATAKEACGTRIIVTNPSPIQWGGSQNKSDKQLRTQANALDLLGAQLRKQGQQLAYHNHDIELREGARELHHMLASTDPDNVKFCLDAHWIFRGCGNSEVAVFDVVRLYKDRIVELHLRQSHDGIWDEAFGSGDIDYDQLAEMLLDLETPPLLVLEQAVEGKTPNTAGAVEAHTIGREYAQKTFAKLIAP
ncbi:xylose isomerase [Blastopirellula marina]|uniref:Xylose isomerase n=1 Tax=Blastopirellula marina TaxID=124 RepID=A0A2S8G314_9BACT|nr:MULTISPECIES: sugar phosphate isomerase/epimerase [Pirellulaceae]PQO38710.1 xylose isomerase [Blastopirellula marina]RCS55018.1 sugar phosphate isomerase/epimerase [Bremerella cremea]